MTKNQNLNVRMAFLLGWTGVVEANGALLGMPPAGAPACRGQAMVPDWSGDWRDCGPLIARYGMTLGSSLSDAYATCRGFEVYRPGIEEFCHHVDVDAAHRAAVVQSVINMLEFDR